MTIRLITKQPHRQLLLDEDGMGEIRVELKLTNVFDDERAAENQLPHDQIRSTTVQAVVDTGAVRSVIPQFVLDKIGVRVRSHEVARYADGRLESVGLTSAVVFEVCGRTTTDEALVLGDEVLIGQTILEKLDLLADCKNRRLVPNPDHPNQPVTKV